MTDAHTAFEAWFKIEFAEWYTAGWEGPLRREGDGYANPTTQANWKAWFACWTANSLAMDEAKAHMRSLIRKLDLFMGLTALQTVENPPFGVRATEAQITIENEAGNQVAEAAHAWLDKANAITPDIIAWIERNTTLHLQVTALYVVDGYEVEITLDDFPISGPFKGDTLRDAYIAAMVEGVRDGENPKEAAARMIAARSAKP